MINSQKQCRLASYSPRLFLLFLRNEKILYPLFVDTEHLITMKIKRKMTLSILSGRLKDLVETIKNEFTNLNSELVNNLVKKLIN